LIELTLLKIANLFGDPVEKKSPELISYPEIEKAVLTPLRSEEQMEDKAKVAIKSEQEILEEGVAEKSSLIQDPYLPKDQNEQNEKDLLSESNENKVSDPIEPLKRPSMIRSTSSISLGMDLNLNDERTAYNLLSSDELPQKFENSNDVKHEELVNTWGKFAKRMEEEGRFNLHATLLSKDPSIDNNEIHFVLENKVQLEALNEVKMDLLLYLRNELQNDTLVFDHSITDSQTILPGSGPMEKFKEMSEKNPLLKEFKDQLDLGLE